MSNTDRTGNGWKEEQGRHQGLSVLYQKRHQQEYQSYKSYQPHSYIFVFRSLYPLNHPFGSYTLETSFVSL